MTRSIPRRTVTAISAVALLLTGCGSAEPEAETPVTAGASEQPTVTDSETPPAAEPSTDAEGAPADAAATTTIAPMPEAEAGLLIADLSEDIPRKDVSQPSAGVFGTPDGTVEITSIGVADTIPGHVLGGPEPAYVPVPGEEFYVFEVSFAQGEDDRTPPTELHLDSQGTRRLVKEMSRGDGSFLASLDEGAVGASLVVSSDGHEQVFDIATGARVADTLTDVYLRRVAQQDLTDVLSYGPVPGYEGRQLTADVRLRSARITPYVPPNIGPERWAESGSMWLVIGYQLEYGATSTGSYERHATLTWTIDGAEPVVQEGRLWTGGEQVVVLSIPADFDSFDVSVANQAEIREGGGTTVKDFGSQSFSLNFPIQ